jgi:hypothetical protein
MHPTMLSYWAALNLVAFREQVRANIVAPTVFFEPSVHHFRSLISFVLADVLIATLDADVGLFKG